MRACIVLTVIAAALVACSGSSAVRAGSLHSACGWKAEAPKTWQHVIWIWMENESYGQVIGTSSARYVTELATNCGLATNYSAITHPSLPNYLAATSGSTWGVADDAPPSSHPISHPSIFSQVGAAGRDWRSYEENMPSACDLSSSGTYAVKHNPAAYFIGIRAQCRKWDIPLGTPASGPFAAALLHSRLPTFAFITPNLCDDMHDCPVATGDTWLRHWMQTILSSPTYRAGETAIFLTFDEGTSSNRVATIVISPSTPHGTRSSTPFDHYSLLKTTEELLALHEHLAHAADPSTHSMRRAFHL